ncbi:glycosyltransferase [Antarcticibacterium flavum]|uniref:Glycosyltransferase n=1 Tax=Antarcticibacterium flavum TaxID=2058175 RepID=A0A5B7X863_9FLAO|nr:MULTISPECIES: glycosyltransferase family 2 protein [Antarcticibacterium]MCM4159358.1 glycosyl transferase [Antarcticibacterium sp. W02-3]QCY70938.1 glycosyltransferase [Antarcticibacterium flavum]
MKTALLISTYNWPEALGVVLKSLTMQVRMPDEVLVADDGSGKETRKIIEAYKEKLLIPIKHIWQEDEGFRKSAILNKAIAQTNADYIIQIDGDCIMHPHFIDDHLNSSQGYTYIYGSRVNIKPEAVAFVIREKFAKFPMFSGAIKNRTRNLRIPVLQKIYKPNSNFSKKTRGCNISYWRKSFIAVNGYDETMEGWGREDSEFVLRLLNNGVKGKRLRYGGIVYHIFHPEKSKENLERNNQIQQTTIHENKTWCKNGVDKYLNQESGR